MSYLRTADELEIEAYSLIRYYHGAIEAIAEFTKFKAVSLRQALNPNYHERQSPITRAWMVMAAWINIHPRSGLKLVQSFVEGLAEHAPNEEVREQLRQLSVTWHRFDSASTKYRTQ